MVATPLETTSLKEIRSRVALSLPGWQSKKTPFTLVPFRTASALTGKKIHSWKTQNSFLPQASSIEY